MSAASQPSSQLCGGSGSFPRGSRQRQSRAAASTSRGPRPVPGSPALCPGTVSLLLPSAASRSAPLGPAQLAFAGAECGVLSPACKHAVLLPFLTKQKQNENPTSLLPPAPLFFLAPFCSKSPLTERVILLVIPSLPPSF